MFPEAIELLRKFAHVDYVERDEGVPRDELLRRIRGKSGLLSLLTERVDAKLIDTAAADGGRLVAICNAAAGFDNIDVAAATRRGVLVTNTPDVLTETTADLSFALLMAAARRVVEGHAFVQSGRWKQWTIDLLVGRDVYGKTLGVFGMGRIGRAVAQRGSLGFGMKVLYCDTKRLPAAEEARLHAQLVSKERLLRESDFVSLHVPLTPSTRRLIGEDEFRLMKRSAVLVNTARGTVVDERALIAALRAGGIAAAGLDVFENEPYVPSSLFSLPNVVVAPHMGSASIDTRRKMSLMAAENLIAALRGERPPNLINPVAWDARQKKEKTEE